MKKIMLIAVLCFSTPFVFASGHDLLDEEACKETKEGIGYFWALLIIFLKRMKKTIRECKQKRKEKQIKKNFLVVQLRFLNLLRITQLSTKCGVRTNSSNFPALLGVFE